MLSAACNVCHAQTHAVLGLLVFFLQKWHIYVVQLLLHTVGLHSCLTNWRLGDILVSVIQQFRFLRYIEV